MDDMDPFVIENNVSMFFSKLAGEPEIAHRATLSRLLVEEENKFARLAGHLDSLDSYIARCDAQIARHRTFLDGDDVSQYQRQLTSEVLANMMAIRSTLRSARDTAARRLDSL